jgi:hypothetical protein
LREREREREREEGAGGTEGVYVIETGGKGGRTSEREYKRERGRENERVRASKASERASGQTRACERVKLQANQSRPSHRRLY